MTESPEPDLRGLFEIMLDRAEQEGAERALRTALERVEAQGKDDPQAGLGITVACEIIESLIERNKRGGG